MNYIFQSVKLLIPIARHKILSRLYLYVYLSFHAVQKDLIPYNLNGNLIDKKIKFPRS